MVEEFDSMGISSRCCSGEVFSIVVVVVVVVEVLVVGSRTGVELLVEPLRFAATSFTEQLLSKASTTSSCSSASAAAAASTWPPQSPLPVSEYRSSSRSAAGVLPTVPLDHTHSSSSVPDAVVLDTCTLSVVVSASRDLGVLFACGSAEEAAVAGVLEDDGAVVVVAVAVVFSVSAGRLRVLLAVLLISAAAPV